MDLWVLPLAGDRNPWSRSNRFNEGDGNFQRMALDRLLVRRIRPLGVYVRYFPGAAR
jgi:hypothetical protein